MHLIREVSCRKHRNWAKRSRSSLMILQVKKYPLSRIRINGNSWSLSRQSLLAHSARRRPNPNSGARSTVATLSVLLLADQKAINQANYKPALPRSERADSLIAKLGALTGSLSI